MKSTFVEQLLEAAPVAIYLYDVAAHRTVLLSGGSMHQLGYLDAKLQTGGGLIGLLHPDDRASFDRQMQRLAATEDGTPLLFEYRLRARDGSWRWFRSHDVVFTRDASGRVREIVGVATDITADRRIGAERDRLVSVIEATSDFIGMAAPDGALLYLNPAGRQLVGLSPDESLAGLRIDDFHPRAEAARMFQHVFPAASRGEPVRTESALRHRDGCLIPVSLMISAHRGRDGRLAYFATIMRDLRGEHRAAAEIDRLDTALATEAARRAAGVERAEGELAARSAELGRELSEPIEAMRRSSRALTARCNGDERRRQRLEELDHAVRRLERLAQALAPPDERDDAAEATEHDERRA